MGKKGKRRLRVYGLLIAILTAFVFSPARQNQFLNWDDDQTITDNPQVRSLSFRNIREIFSEPYGEIYNPLTTLSYAVEYRLYGYDSEVIHVDAIALHAANSVLALVLALLVSGSLPVALVTSLLFAVHPLRVESVAWATERKDVLYGFFYFLGLICYVFYSRRGGRAKHYVSALACMALSGFAKAMAVSFPVAMLALDFVFRRKLDKKLILEKLPFFALSLVFGVVAIQAQQGSGWVVGVVGLSLVRRLAIVSYALGLYLWKFLVPIHLSAIYPYPGSVSWEIPVILLGLAAAVVCSLKLTRKIAFGAVFFLSAIAMILPWQASTKFIAADRLCYVGLFGLFYVVGEGFRVLDESPWPALRRRRGWLHLGVAGLVAVFAVLSAQRCAVWRDSYTLMSDVIAKYPDATDAYINRAMATPDGERALADYTRALELDPTRGVAYNNRGLLHYTRGEYRAASDDYDEGIRRDPTYSNLYYNRMLFRYAQTKDYVGALQDLKSAEREGAAIGPELREKIESAAKGAQKPVAKPIAKRINGHAAGGLINLKASDGHG